MSWPTGLCLHARLLGGVVIVSLAAQIVLRDRYGHEHLEIQKEAFLQRSREMEARWKALPYTNATGVGFCDAFLGRIDWSSLKLSELQQSRLKVRLRELLSYLQDPKFEDYYRLKTEGLRYRFLPAQEVQELFSKTQGRDLGNQPREARQIVEWLWKGIHTRTEYPSLPKMTAGCLDQIAVATSPTNSSWSLLSGKVGKGFTVADLAYEPGFRYLSLDKSGSEASGTGLFFQLSFFAKFNGSDYASPVYISLGWLEQEQTWALCGMVTDTWARIKTMF